RGTTRRTANVPARCSATAPIALETSVLRERVLAYDSTKGGGKSTALSNRSEAPCVGRDTHDRVDQRRIPRPPGAARRPLFDRARARPRRYGDRAARPGCGARPPGRDQAAPAPPRDSGP